jgi:hypothetical protein
MKEPMTTSDDLRARSPSAHGSGAPRAITIGAGLLVALAACSGTQTSAPALPAAVRSVIFLQRVPQTATGNVFDYTAFQPGGRIVKLEPPSPDGKLTVLTADPMWDGADIMSWDLSFDATQIAFSARTKDSTRYHIFTMSLVDPSAAGGGGGGAAAATPTVTQVTEGDNDYVYPIFLPGQKLMFTTNKNVEADTPQFEDEYERAVTAQVGTINLDGSNEVLGPRNVSHRVAPALLPDGHVLYTEWRHLGPVNDGHLRLINGDMTTMREAFGGEAGGVGGTNSYLRGRFVAQTPTGVQIVAVGTSRDRTLQAGKLLLINLAKSEATSSFEDMTPLVPGDNQRSFNGVGRYYDAEPVGAVGSNTFLVSWADGAVQSEVVATAGNANFGLYVFQFTPGSTTDGVRHPLYDDPNYWEVQARPVLARPEPPVTSSPIQGDGFVISAINVYDTSLPDQVNIPAGAAVNVRLIEGFSGEEGPRMFGTTEFDGQSLYGEVPVAPDGSFSARVPGNVPVHQQVIDKFGIALADEPVWISGRAGEQRTCGGCHEDRSKSPTVLPGQVEAIVQGAVDLDVPRADRVSMDFSPGKVRGVPWDKAIQPILDAKCISCHDGDPAKPGNPSFTVTDMTTGTAQTFVFDLTGKPLAVTVGEKMTGAFTASYISVMGLGEVLGDDAVSISGTPFDFAQGANARGSKIIELLNPPQRYPVVDTSVRRYPGAVHPVDVGGIELAPDEYYLLGLSIDMGGQFYSRENKDEAVAYNSTGAP